jgi:hypothetical protein
VEAHTPPSPNLDDYLRPSPQIIIGSAAQQHQANILAKSPLQPNFAVENILELSSTFQSMLPAKKIPIHRNRTTQITDNQ